MIYKTELHAHSRDISECSNASVEDIVEKYVRYGYTSLLLTNHFERGTMTRGGDKSFEDFVKRFYDAYEKLKSIAGDKLNILFGAEIRFDQNYNDYLLFGATKEKLIEVPKIWELGIKKYHARANEMGMLIFQAHPFRKGMTIIDPESLDGIETYNGHPGHNSSNDIAQAWARKYNMRVSSGSDHHDTVHMPTGGILTDVPITKNDELVDVLANQKLSLISKI